MLDKSPEQAVGGDAEGRAELGFNAHNEGCPVYRIGVIHTTSWAMVLLHRPASSFTDWVILVVYEDHDSENGDERVSFAGPRIPSQRECNKCTS